MLKKWTLKKYDDEQSATLADELSVPKLLGILLNQRGIKSFDQAKRFFRPSLSELHDPFLMKGMKLAVDRIIEAINSKEKILIYGDYDVDGTCSVAMVYQFLSHLTKEIEYYIPDRYAEGYGLSDQGVDYAIDKGFSLVITLDCGIKSVEKVHRASLSKVDFIICDHHLPAETLPPAIAVLDAKQEGCSYPYDELCGCGVGFKLLQGLTSTLELDSTILIPYLDLVALAIAADIVPMDGENRILCYYGLQEMNKSPRTGISAMLPITKQNELKIEDLVFTLAPRINAAGRIRSGKFAVALLIEENETEAKVVSEQIEKDNTYRRELDKSITKEAYQQLIQLDPTNNKKSTVVFQEDWHKGVVGIVASRLIEKRYKPTVVLCQSGDTVTGSARSVPGFDLYNALDSCTAHLIQFGGHKHAAGMTLKPEQVESFREKFEAVVSQRILDSQLQEEILIDLDLELSDLNPKLYRIIQQMAPFGPQNREPIFMTQNVIDAGYTKIIGKEGEHLKLHIKQGNSQAIDAIAFNYGSFYEDIKKGILFDISYSLQENTWNGKTKLQLMIKDIHLK